MLRFFDALKYPLIHEAISARRSRSEIQILSAGDLRHLENHLRFRGQSRCRRRKHNESKDRQTTHLMISNFGVGA